VLWRMQILKGGVPNMYFGTEVDFNPAGPRRVTTAGVPGPADTPT
jgi:hypothetical protein